MSVADPNGQRTIRNRAVDGIRGIAALCVCLEHALLMPFWVRGLECCDHSNEHLATRLLGGLGNISVSIFFVISGFVLTSALEHRSYGRFLLWRAVRLWPVCIAAILLGAVLPTTEAVSVPGILAELLMAHRDYTVNPPMWSLAVEFRAALAWPLVVWLGADIRRLLLLPLVYLAGEVVGADGDSFGVGRTFEYLPLFVLGRWSHTLRDLPRMPGLRTFLESRPVQGLGTISFSLYAVQFPIIGAIVYRTPALPWQLQALAGIIGAFVTAHLLHRALEIPSLNWSRRVGRSGMLDSTG